MRPCAVFVCAVLAASLSNCSAGDSGSASVAPADAGTGGGSTDAGSTLDAGTGPGATDAGAAADAGSGGGSDGGTVASDCDGLLPPPPSAPSQFRWAKQDLNTISGGTCNEAETDGTGHVALSWDGFEQPHATRYAFVDPASGTAAGTYQGTRLGLIGQLSGFIGANCVGAICAENYVVVDPVGKDLFRSAFQGSGGTQANDPTGGNGPRAIFG